MTHPYSIPILMYHQVRPEPHPYFRKYAVTPHDFAAQMAYLRYAGYRAISLDTLLACRTNDIKPPRRAVIITFDDGFQDNVDHAVPILRRYGFTATFYLVTNNVGGLSTWLRQERGVEFPLFNWVDARRLEAAGFDCGSHTSSHPRLSDLTEVACRRELRDAKLLLEERLGHSVGHLAYPFGAFDARVQALAREVGYRSAVSVNIGRSASSDDPFALHRVPVVGGEGLFNFVTRLWSGHTVGEWLRDRAGLHGRLSGFRVGAGRR